LVPGAGYTVASPQVSICEIASLSRTTMVPCDLNSA
jgi:hypothetical protein